jgi:hypothetical protein
MASSRRGDGIGRHTGLKIPGTTKKVRVGSIPTPGTAMQFPYGNLIPPPDGFAPPEAWEEFGALAYPVSLCRREAVGTSPRGMRWSAWPLTFEEYVSDTEPDLDASHSGELAYNRIVTWRRIARTDTPKGWRQLHKKPWRIDAFFELKDDTYVNQWHKDTRRNLREWRTQAPGRYAIEEVSLEEFVAAYRTSTTYKKIGLDQLHSLVRKHAMPLPRKHLTLWGVRDLKSGKLIAGTGVFFFPERGASVRECPFATPQGRAAHAIVGLMDHWFAESLQRGIARLQFTHFWHPGAPRAWKGFSEFKSHFGLQYVAYPPELWRFVRGKFW